MYATFNYKTKKALKTDVATLVAERMTNEQPLALIRLTNRLTVYQPNGDFIGITPKQNGTVYVEGPHYPEPHRWYAQCEIKDGVIVKVI